jgi:glucokinase
MAEANGGYEVVRSVGVSAPSANYLTGCIENASNIPWKGVIPLAAMLRDRVGLAVALGNDAHATALGEHVYGSARGMENFIVVSLGHGGVGSCFFSGGHPHLGTGGYAGEFGHICVVDGGRQCTCGRKGCLEEYASYRGIVQTAREILDESDEPSLLRELEELTPMAIGKCCDKGDKLARKVYDITGLYLGIGIANYASVINPEAIILTGELTEASKWYMDSLLSSFDEHVFGNIRGKVKIQVSVLDNHERDILGASALAWTVQEYSLFL